MRILKGWRTRGFAALIFVLGILELFSPNLLSDAFGVGQQGRAIITIAVGLAVFLLRQITTTPPGAKY